jgi:hypothetical protein
MMTKFRWAGKAVVGTWYPTENKALYDALRFGQATLNSGKGQIISLRSFASIERRDI